MREIRTARTIDAPPRIVWSVLTDLDSYREWNPQIPTARGDLREGETLEIEIRRGGSRKRPLSVTVTDVDPPRRLEWVGRVFSSLLFEGRHSFELEALPDGRTRLINRERLSGWLAPLLVGDDPEADYEAMNRSLANRAERRATIGF